MIRQREDEVHDRATGGHGPPRPKAAQPDLAAIAALREIGRPPPAAVTRELQRLAGNAAVAATIAAGRPASATPVQRHVVSDEELLAEGMTVPVQRTLQATFTGSYAAAPDEARAAWEVGRNYVRGTPRGEHIVRLLDAFPGPIGVEVTDAKPATFELANVPPSFVEPPYARRDVIWNPERMFKVKRATPRAGRPDLVETAYQSSGIALAHELGHALQSITATPWYVTHQSGAVMPPPNPTGRKFYEEIEDQNVTQNESAVAAARGEPQRAAYRDGVGELAVRHRSLTGMPLPNFVTHFKGYGRAPADPFQVDRELPRVVIDHPVRDEHVTSATYAIRIGASAATDNVRVRIDAGPWEQARRDVGYWWFDWTGITPGRHTVASEGWNLLGQRVETNVTCTAG